MGYLVESIGCLISIIIIVMLMHDVNADRCSRRDPFTNSLEEFDCPRLFESRKKKFCCGMTNLQGYCCEWSKKTQEVYLGPNVSKAIFQNFLNIIVVALLIIGGLIAACCICACVFMSRKRQYRGQVISTEGDHPVAPVTGYPTQHMGYPMAPLSDQPPPYPYAAPQPPYNPSYQIK